MTRRRWLTLCALLACPGWARSEPPAMLAAVARGRSAANESTTQFLPLFPLGLVAFPGELVFLHIFEPRYRQLIAECAETGMRFGIVTPVPDGVSSIGTEMALDRILRIGDSGDMDVATRGTRAFRLQSVRRLVEGRLYSGGLVAFNRNDPKVEPRIQSALVELYNRMQHPRRRSIEAPYPDNLSFLIGHDVGLSRDQKLQLLTMEVEMDRQRYLLQHLLRGQ